MNKLNAAVKKSFTAFLVILTILASSIVMKPISVSAETKDWEQEFSAQVIEEGKKMVGKVKYDLDGKWYDNGKGYSDSRLATECNGYVRRILVNALYAVEGKGAKLPDSYQGLKTVTSGGLDLQGRLRDINPTVLNVPSNLQNADNEPNMARVNAYLDQFGAGTVVYFEKPNGDRHWAIYAGKENGVHMAIHSSPKKRGADTGWNHAFYEPFEELWLSKGSGYVFELVYMPMPPLPGEGEAEFTKVDSNGKVVQGAVFGLYDEDGFISRRTTNTSGKALWEGLIPGDYYVKEESAPAPLIVDTATKWHFTIIPGETVKIGTNGKIVNEIARGRIDITKVSNHGDPMVGVKFNVVDVSNNKVVASLTTGANGKVSTEVPLGTYDIIETATINGFVLDATPQRVTISYKDQVTPVVVVSKNITNTHQRGDLIITKTENDWDKLQTEYNGIPIENVTFNVIARNDIYEGSQRVYLAGELVGERVTDKAGQVKYENLPLGLYNLREIIAADGYVLSDTIIPIEIKYDSANPTVKRTLTEVGVENQIKYGSVEFTKTSCENNCTVSELLPGATYELRRSSDDKVLKTLVSDENGRIVVQDLRYSTNKGYYFIETKAPEGYFLSEEKIYFDITEHHIRVYRTASNKPVRAHVQFTKVDEDNVPLYKDVEFRVRDFETKDFVTVDVVKGNKVEKQTKWSPVEDGSLFIEGLFNHGEYELVETKTPEGFVPMEPLRFTIDAEQDFIDLGLIVGKSLDLGTIVNEYIKSPILIKKTDKLTGVGLEGVVFGAFKDGELVGTYTTGADGTVLTDIFRYGVITIEEQFVPVPYVINPDKKTQEVNITEHDIVYEVVFENVPTKIIINKADATTGEPLEGVGFEVYKNGQRVFEGLTNEEGQLIIEGYDFGEYTIKEVSVKAPYVINPDAQTQIVTLSEDNHTQSVTFKNDVARGQIVVEKKDAKNLKPVHGAKYAVLNAGDLSLEDITANFKWTKDDLGNVIAIEDLGLINLSEILFGEFITDKNGLIDLGNLDLSRYFIVELESPYGYQLDPQVYEINIEYLDQNTPIVKHTLEIKEARAKGIIQIAKKDSVSKKLIDFAKNDLFKAELVNSDGTRVLILPESVEDGIFTYVVDLLEIYEFREENPPVGYNKSKEVIRLDTHKPVEDRIYYVEYFNKLTPVVMLPPTGLYSYTALGFGLVAVGTILVLIKKRKQSGEH